MLLYDNALSGNCYKVRLMLARLGIAYERVDMDVTDRSNREDAIGRAASPALRVPTLRLDDGRFLAESNAIILYLADGSDLIPSDRYERAKMLQWMFYEQYDHEPNLAVARFWVRIRGTPPDPEALAERQAGSNRALAAMESHLQGRTFFVGETFTLADISLYPYTHLAPEAGVSLDPYPAVRAWIDRVASQPGHVTIDA